MTTVVFEVGFLSSLYFWLQVKPKFILLNPEFGWIFMVNAGKYTIHGCYGFFVGERYDSYDCEIEYRK